MRSGRRRQRNPADGGEDGDVQGAIGEFEHRRPRDRAAGTQIPLVIGKAHTRLHRTRLLDPQRLVAGESLRKFHGQPTLDFRGVEGKVVRLHPHSVAYRSRTGKLAPAHRRDHIASMSDALPAPQSAAFLRVEDAGGGVRVVTLDNPPSRNALSLEMLDALSRAVSDAHGDSSVRVLVVAANGPAFSSGHDLKQLTGHRADPDGGRTFFEQTFAACSAFMQSLVALPKPVIAAVEGLATAAGCQLVATCDLAIAGESARFCTPGVSIGLFCTTPMVGLVRNVPRKSAMEMLLTGEPIDAAEAHRIGLVNRVVPQGQALDEALALAARIATRSAMTLATGKRAFYDGVDRPLADAYDRASRVMTENMLAEDAAEGIGAFVEKRPPAWRDR